METENVSLTKKLTETREKYNKCRAHLDDIKAMLTSQNLKNVIQENVELCKTRVTNHLVIKMLYNFDLI